ncbi:MAG TPA: acyltransferase [Chloroflexota bacterium]|nr:acyltransferase [Chloroflexota bacterium]
MISPNVFLGQNVVIHHPEQVNLYGCRIGDNCKIASFVEIQRGAILGNNVKVEAFAFIPTGVVIEDGAFIGPHVCFTNDRYPAAVGPDGELLTGEEWEVVPTIVRRGAAIGAQSVIVCGVTIGEGALVGAGSVVTRDVPPGALVRGNPARVAGKNPNAAASPPAASPPATSPAAAPTVVSPTSFGPIAVPGPEGLAEPVAASANFLVLEPAS